MLYSMANNKAKTISRSFFILFTSLGICWKNKIAVVVPHTSLRSELSAAAGSFSEAAYSSGCSAETVRRYRSLSCSIEDKLATGLQNRTQPPNVFGSVRNRTRLDHATRAVQRMYAAARGSFGVRMTSFLPRSRRCCGSRRSHRTTAFPLTLWAGKDPCRCESG